MQNLDSTTIRYIYYLEHKQNKINLEETYSSLFKGSDINENKKNK